jgi:putative ABC transport system permease protein
MLAKRPGFTFIAVITLALGIGANTAIFSVINGVLLRPLPYPRSERLVQIWETFPIAGASADGTGVATGSVSVPIYMDWKNQNTVLDDMSAFNWASFTLQANDNPEQVPGAYVTATFFDTLGLKPKLGRTFAAGEDQPGNGQVVILSDGLWQANFGGDPRIIDQQINLNGRNFIVIGVMPPEMSYPRNARLWAPLVFTEAQLANRGSHAFLVLGRIKEGITLKQAQQEMDIIAAGLAQQYAENKTRGVRLVELQEQMVSFIRPALMVLMGAVGFVLLIACTNVANLLLARAAGRHKETAIRIALGAGTLRLVRQFLTEGVILSMLGGVVGLFLAWWGIDLLMTMATGIVPRTGEVQLDGNVLIFTLIISILTGLAFGLAPAFQVARTRVQEALTSESRSAIGSARTNSLRSALVVVEIAMAFILLIGAGLLIRSFIEMQQVSPGLDPENALTMRITLPPEKYSDDASTVAFYDHLLERLKSNPSVESAGVISHLPFSSWGFNGNIKLEGKGPFPPGEAPLIEFRVVSPDYFRSLGIPLVRGRYLTEQDGRNSPGVIINKTMADQIWPGEEPIGKHVFDDPVPIVGVVGDVKFAGLEAQIRPEVYIPYAMKDWRAVGRNMALVVRSRSEAGSLTAAIRREVQAVDPAQPVYSIRPMSEVISLSSSPRRFNTLLLGVLAGVSLILAMIGIYGVMNYSVTQRTREIGIRMALGATSSDVMRMVVGQGMKLAIIGVAIGVAGAIAVTRLIESMLFKVSTTDTVTFAVVAAALVGVASLACYIPARRAIRVDPMVALRYE